MRSGRAVAVLRLALLPLAAAPGLDCTRQSDPGQLPEAARGPPRAPLVPLPRAPSGSEPRSAMEALEALAVRTSGSPDRRRLFPPGDLPTAHLGTIAVKLIDAVSLVRVDSKRGLSLTTSERFVRVELVSQNVGEDPAHVTLAPSRLKSGEQVYALAMDAQQIAGTWPLARTFPVGERIDWVLLFEVTQAAIDAGLTLELRTSSTTSDGVELPLQ